MIKSAVSASFAASRLKPGANISATQGAINMAIAVKTKSEPPNTPATRLTSALTCSCVPPSLTSVSTGTKACEKAPSANSLRRKLGILKATKKASALGAAPKRLAKTTSRARPRTLDSIVPILTMRLEPRSPRFFGGDASKPSLIRLTTQTATDHRGEQANAAQ